MTRSLAGAALLVVTLLTPGCSPAQAERIVLRNASPAMEPTLAVGELVTVAPFRDTADVARAAAHGDLVVFAFPQEDTVRFIKRLVGLPGDTLAMQRGILLRNGQRVDEPYARFADSSAAAQRHNWGPFVLEPGSYFVLGDNRDHSLDGRHWGPVPARLLFGRAIHARTGEPRR